MKNFKRNVKGITLIALVITIIVLLILAGVTIAMLTGENGILKMATKASDEYKKASEEDQQTLEEIEWEMYDIINGNDNEPVPEGTYYSIRNGKEKTYYETFKKAYEASVDNGGKYRGGTIVVEKDVTENVEEPIIINKTITIDLKQNTMTRNHGIYITSGTLTITGKDSSAIIGSGEDMILLYLANDANLTVTGSPLIQSTSHAIYTVKANHRPGDLSPDVTISQSSGTVNLQGGYMVSTNRAGINMRGTGKVLINNTTVLGIRNDKCALSIEEDSTSDIVIDGNSIIANGAIMAVEDGLVPSISVNGSGNLTLKGNTIVTAGLYGSNAVNLKKPITINIEDNASLYSQTSRTVLVKTNGTTLNINTKGTICSRTALVPVGIYDGVGVVNCNIQSGIFASGITNPLQQVQTFMKNYPEEETRRDIDYYYLDQEDFKTLKTVIAQNLYVVKIGVN